MRTRSVYKRLLLGLAAIGLVSSLLLLGAVFIDYNLGYSDLTGKDAARKAWHEVFEHVVLPALLFVVPIGLAVIVVVQRALQPLVNAAREIEAARDQERGFRLDVGRFPAEARPFAVALNDLLARVELFAAQQEAFAADVAHELRTPLALARLELDAIGGEAKMRLTGDLQSMQRLIDQLLLLAQVKAAGSAEMPHEPQDLAVIARECVAALAPAAIADGVELEFEGVDGAAIAEGWHEAIQAGLRNLIENALRVTPADGTVQVFAGPGPTLSVRDGGPGLSSDQLDSLVRRHARAENASRSGAGLGLAIVDQIMRAHGGHLRTEPGRRELRLEFPSYRTPSRQKGISSMTERSDHLDPGEEDFDAEAKAAIASRSTWVSVVVNSGLSLLQIAIGLVSKSQGLVADGIHSLSDLIADFLVLFVSHHSRQEADDQHQYGHHRFENAASLALGVLLGAVGMGMLWSAVGKIEHPETIARVEVIALYVAGGALVAKELLFRYMLAAAKRVKSSLLVANAWHARSDAASSLVVGFGIAGNLLGYPFLDPIAALIVGIMILKMGWKFGWEALHDLMDQSADAEEVAAIEQTIRTHAGVLGVHRLRTRKMGDMLTIDVHIDLTGDLSVRDSHAIVVEVEARVMARHRVLGMMTHVDPA